MDPASCRVVYIDDRFPAEKCLTREVASSPIMNNKNNHAVGLGFGSLPLDLQANISAILCVFHQVFVCNTGRSFSAKLAEIQESVKSDCTPILAFFDVDSDYKHHHSVKHGGQKPEGHNADPLSPRPVSLRRQMTFSSEADESYGLQLLSRIASDLQVDEGVKLVIPVALVRAGRKNSIARPVTPTPSPYSSKGSPLLSAFEEKPSPVDPRMMLQCLDAGALDVIPSPLNNEKIMGLTVHAYRIYKTAKNEQSAFLASASKFIAAARRRKQSWVGIEEEKPYSYLREAMVKKLLKTICEPETIIEDYQHRDLDIEDERKKEIMKEVGKWSFCAHDFSEDELVYAGYYMLNHALKMPELAHWCMNQDEILRFMQASQVAYNSFVLYHNFRHAVDVLQAVFYFLVQIGTIPPYPVGSTPPPSSQEKSPIAQLLKPFEALTLLISAIGHDVGHPGVNNMFLVKLNAPLAQLYNDQSVLEAFHCAAYSQILRRHWPSVFADKSLRRLLISSILATDMGVHSDYMQQLGHLQEKIHESKTTDGWAPKDIDGFRILTCGLLIKCADISNVARPWVVAERWTHLLQREFASQGEMENQVGMDTTLFGGPPEIGNVMRLANGQIGFMGIFAHPLFANVTDVIPAIGFAAAEILNNKNVWITRIEQEKRILRLRNEGGLNDGAVSPRSQSPAPRKPENIRTAHIPGTEYFPSSPLRDASIPPSPRQQVKHPQGSSIASTLQVTTADDTPRNSSQLSSWNVPFMEKGVTATLRPGSASQEVTPTSSGVSPSVKPYVEAQRPEVQARRSSNTVPRSLQINGVSEVRDGSTTTTTASSEHGVYDRKRETNRRRSAHATTSIPLVFDDSVPDLPNRQPLTERDNSISGKSQDQEQIVALSKYCPVPDRPHPQAQSQVRRSGRASFSSTTYGSSMATGAGRTHSTNPSSALSPSTEATSFLGNASSDGQFDDHRNARRDRTTRQDSGSERIKSRPGVLPEVVPTNTMSRTLPFVGSDGGGGGTTKGSAKTSTAAVNDLGKETMSTWGDGDGDRSIRKRRINRLKFWRKRTDEEEIF